MVIKHLTSGTTEPPLQDGMLRLYSMRFCPFSHIAYLLLAVKQVPHDIVYINLDDKPEWYIDLIPLAKVPAIYIPEHEMFMMETLTISHFLDEHYLPRLYSTVYSEREKEKQVIEDFSNVTRAYSKLNMSPIPDKQLLEDLLESLDLYEKKLSQKKTLYYGGNIARITDYMIWPWFERLEIFSIMYGEQFKIPYDRYPHLLNWTKTMMKNEAVQKFYLKPEVYVIFRNSRKDGKYTKYDII